jgi:hypothetical protein
VCQADIFLTVYQADIFLTVCQVDRYIKVKKAILKRYELTSEAYRRKLLTKLVKHHTLDIYLIYAITL